MRLIVSVIFTVFILLSCSQNDHSSVEKGSNGKLNIVTTTGMINDIVLNLGGDKVETVALMGPGVDPHLYKASAKDVNTLSEADIIFYNGLHLEGKIVDVFENMSKRGVYTVPVAKGVDKSKLLRPESFEGYYDPHIWFDVELWMTAVDVVRDSLIKKDPDNKQIYDANAETYLYQLNELQQYIKTKVKTLPKGKRVLITAHDAFGYFGLAYDFEVIGLQGVSTASEVSTADVQRLSKLIVERNVPSIFVESSVSPKYIEAVKEAVRAKGFNVEVGGVLYSDALGDPGTPEAEYIGMFKYNVNKIVDSLNYEKQ